MVLLKYYHGNNHKKATVSEGWKKCRKFCWEKIEFVAGKNKKQKPTNDSAS